MSASWSPQGSFRRPNPITEVGTDRPRGRGIRGMCAGCATLDASCFSWQTSAPPDPGGPGTRLSDTQHQAVEATVTAELSQRLFRLEMSDGNQLVAGPSEEAKRLGVQIRTGQRVLVRKASLDPGRGMIIGLAEPPHQAQGSNESKS